MCSRESAQRTRGGNGNRGHRHVGFKTELMGEKDKINVSLLFQSVSFQITFGARIKADRVGRNYLI